MISKVEISPSTLIFHELIGLDVKVILSTNPALIGIRGRVVDETKNMLVIENAESRILKIPKADSEFIFRIPAELSEKGRRSETFVKIQGNLLLSQPENRIKNIKKLRKWG
ncbi:ribonuclease P protein component 1 [Methanosarcina sp. KYL-1]|uniref:ribonuclease P protein component 1 n=1 Tax=Methanosarcina sp. KYL-1 TaxID=2602068 RepID=UPI002100990A|nr:ribonuclease P protein component 1 [Methanosarcina sp. KYL-1]MCQ1535515.1 ribonuclease P protein component 1 [Methanosarcina sp. KYL-1]